MGLSFHDEPSLVEAIGSLRFEAMPETGSISLDESLCTGPHDPNSIPEVMSIEEKRDESDNDIGWGDDIQIVDR